MAQNFVDGDIYEEIREVLSKTEEQIEWVENLPVSNQDDEDDRNAWLAWLIKTRDVLSALVNDSFPNTIRMMADKESGDSNE